MRRLIAAAALLFCVSAMAAEISGADMTAGDFIARVRHPSNRQNYARLDGTISHLRRGDDEASTVPVYFGTILTGDRQLSQLIVNNNEGYRIGQSYVSGSEGTTVTPMKQGGYPDSLLGRFGVKPEDLSMSFLFWNPERELEPVTMRTVDCRVFLMKDPASKEGIRITISSEYFFPLKVEFFNDLDKDIAAESEPYRSLEVEKFKKTDNGFWVPTLLKIQGPGWRTRIEFTGIEAAEFDPKAPVNVVRRLQ
ncbi:MAG: hypothetical protein AB7F40_07275 [Victivallaceae bacterium]|nr:hypothetical protein [Victivallaceae bacterium]